MKRLKVLISAYACEPDKGSEPAVGWNIAREMSKYYDVWVITRANNREAIEKSLEHTPVPNLTFIYFDLPQWARWWKRNNIGIQIYYYLWQACIYFVARRLIKRSNFHIVHHLTFARYWAPSFLSLLPVPFLWGPVGGGESTPPVLYKSLNTVGRQFENVRSFMRWIGEHDPFVRLTAIRSKLALATSEETAQRLRALGAQKVEVFSQLGISPDKLESVSKPRVAEKPKRKVRFISVGKLIQWKGFHLGLRAFAQSKLHTSDYLIVGDGGEKLKLEQLANELNIQDQITFLGKLAPDEALEKILSCDVLVHPSLHDSGGFVCIEAMSFGKPVICLDLGGPGQNVPDTAGHKVEVINLEQVINELSETMRHYAFNDSSRAAAGLNGRTYVQENFIWSVRGAALANHYNNLSHKMKN